MIKKLLIIFLLCLPSLGWSATYDVCSSGCDYTQSTFENLSGTGYAGDIFYFSGTFSSQLDVNIEGSSLTDKVTLDGWEGGTCNPPSTTCSSAANMNDRINILSGVDYIIIKDFDVYASHDHIKTQYNDQVKGLEVRNCTFDDASASGSIMDFSILEDFVIDNNRLNGAYAQLGNGIVIHAANRGRMTNNWTTGSKVGWHPHHRSDRAGTGDQRVIQKVVVANNEIYHTYWEGLSFDMLGNSDHSGFYERDSVDSSPAPTTTTVSLSDSGWGGGDDPDYIGMHMIFSTGNLAGRHAKITGQADETFTLSQEGSLDFTDVSAGDEVVIAAINRKNYIGYNTVDDIRFNPATILLYGNNQEFLIEGNTATNDDGLELNSRSLHEVKVKPGSVTGACGWAPDNANLWLNNTVTSSGGKAYIEAFNNEIDQCSGVPQRYSYYNTVLNNTLDGSGTDERIWFEYQYGYVNGNTGSGSGLDPDLTNSTDNIAWKVYWPYITGTPEIDANGNYVTITFSENIDVSNYSTGNAWAEDANENKIDLAYFDGDGTTTIVFSAQSTINTGTTWYFWFDGTDDSVQDTDGNDMVVYGFKPTTLGAAYVPPGGGSRGVSIN